MPSKEDASARVAGRIGPVLLYSAMIPTASRPHAIPGPPYGKQRVVLLTQHGKEKVLAPLFRAHLGADLEVIRTFDTDTLGTFTRDVARAGTQRDAARTKARLAITQSGCALGVGSEGAVVPGPLGLGAWHVELVVFVDAERDLEVVGHAHEVGVHVHGLIHTRDELEALAARAGFPDHGLVLRPNSASDPRYRKGIRTTAELWAAFDAVRAEATDGGVFAESDLRADQHPTRMAVIAKAGLDLVERLATRCLACEAPGVGRIRAIPGLPCSACGTSTDVARAELFGCVRCTWREERPRNGPATAEPAQCPHCNP